MSSFEKYIATTLTGLAVLVTLAPATASAQVPEPLFLSGSIGFHVPQTGDFSQAATEPFRDEHASQQSNYKASTGLLLDVGAGYKFTPMLGAAVSFSRAGGGSNPATFSLTYPHPLLFDAHVTRSSTSRDLDHAQRSFHLSAVFTPELSSAYDVKIFGGPSRIYVDQELVADIAITETLLGGAYDFTINEAIISGESVCACAWGFHIGADISRYLTPVMGVGVMVRYARATVEMQNAAGVMLGNEDATADYTAGGFTLAGGVRFRFGLFGSDDD